MNLSCVILRCVSAAVLLLCSTGCGILPRAIHQPTFHNPFPQLSRVAIAPFFNLTSEPTVDGRQFALAYYNELQLIPGFEVVPVGVVETAIKMNGLTLGDPADVRKLADLLGVDAVVIGAITDFSPYYPPRCGMKVEWYAANPCYHPIPAGYGLPWGTAEEEFIPEPLVLETEMALARAQLKTQSPLPPGPSVPTGKLLPVPQPAHPEESGAEGLAISAVEPVQCEVPAEGALPVATMLADGSKLPADWPDPRGLIPDGPSAQRLACEPTGEPVLSHTRNYNGHDADFTTALETYVLLRDEARFGGWQSYLQRSDDFIRFCCYKHIAEMLTARGGAGESQVVWRWPDNR